MSDMKKSYYAIIPASVRYDKNIRANSKLLYGEITALCNEKGYCWANNNYFAELYEVSKTSISLWIKDLIEAGYISTELIYKEGSKEILHRYLRIVNDPPQQMLNTPPQQKLKDNTTSFNTTINKDTMSSKLDGNDSSKKSTSNIPYKVIIDHLNEKCGKNYRNVESNKKLIRARFNEGYTLDDFKKVIDIKSSQWYRTGVVIDNKPAETYLRPVTLFGNKFDGYLNEMTVKSFKPKREMSLKEKMLEDGLL